MIVLLSALVVMVAAVVLVVGMISGTFSLVYAGLGLAAAGVVLLLIARFLGRSRNVALPDEPEPLPGSRPAGTSPEVSQDVEPLEVAFPIARYDSLWVTQIVPLLAALSSDELAVVDARERGGRHRAGVLDAIDAVRCGDAPVPEESTPDLPPPPLAATEVPVVGDQAPRVPTFLGRPAAPIDITRS